MGTASDGTHIVSLYILTRLLRQQPGFSPSPGQYSPKDDSCYGGNKKAVTASVAYSNWAYGYGYTGLVEQGSCYNAGFVKNLGPEHGPSDAGAEYNMGLTKWTK